MANPVKKALQEKYKLTRLDLISIGVIVIIVLITVIQWFNHYRSSKKLDEARNNLELIFDAEANYFNTNQSAYTDSRRSFLSVPPQPSEPSFYRKPGDFNHGDWAKLNVKITDPVYFSYSVKAEGTGNEAIFTALARGDLNGDGKFSRWELVGRIGPKGQIVGRYQLFVLDPDE